jgi:hypothetical protein
MSSILDSFMATPAANDGSAGGGSDTWGGILSGITQLATATNTVVNTVKGNKPQTGKNPLPPVSDDSQLQLASVPWYKNTKYLMIGGAVLLLLIVGGTFMFKRKG